ncbi:hypothetical protein R3W88_004329 [Solanum pinnatisectum]|uniref:F-box/LRR-repeat protein 15/At3g58940/PEG3-like LRR domain-containing protein n=1 Tax=Solanum pinnatisectum TaxID=50273 RepID=A0AAV9K903_9SOLN|nr:hypothetical protein R3W88_004329 [Solanum pinnatisectum]
MSNQDQFYGNSESQIIKNSAQKILKNETKCEEIDRINAFRTTILSKDWYYFWTCINNIVYDNEEYGRSDSLTVQKFISLTDNVLPLLSCSTIKKFSLNLCSNMMMWLEFAVNKEVEDLRLNIHYTIHPTEHEPYSLHEVLCSSSPILKINCENCRILKDCVLKWTSLKSLTLKDLFLWDGHIKKIMSNCPQLESLKRREFCGFDHLHMTSPKCRRLELIRHGYPYGDWYSFEGDTCCIEIVAPYVEHLTISGDFSSSNQANLDLDCDEFDEIDENIVKDLLVSPRCANELILSSWFIKVISILMLEEEDVSLPLLEYRWLTISSCISKLPFPRLDNLLRETPKLENLMIFPGRTICFLFFSYFRYHPFYEDEETNLSKDKKYLPIQENIFKVSLQNLKNVKVMSLCSHTYTYDAIELHQFLKFLLEHVINLEILVIVAEHNDCNNCSTNTSNLMKYLLPFPTSAIISLGPVSHNVFYSKYI